MGISESVDSISPVDFCTENFRGGGGGGGGGGEGGGGGGGRGVRLGQCL